MSKAEHVDVYDTFSKMDPFVSSVIFTEGRRHITLVPPWGVKNIDNHPTWQLPWNVTLPFIKPAVDDFFIEDKDTLYNNAVATLHFRLAKNLNFELCGSIRRNARVFVLHAAQ